MFLIFFPQCVNSGDQVPIHEEQGLSIEDIWSFSIHPFFGIFIVEAFSEWTTQLLTLHQSDHSHRSWGISVAKDKWSFSRLLIVFYWFFFDSPLFAEEWTYRSCRPDSQPGEEQTRKQFEHFHLYAFSIRKGFNYMKTFRTLLRLDWWPLIMSYDLLLTGSIIAGQASAWYAWPHLQV